jgi:hypothetical protein
LVGYYGGLRTNEIRNIEFNKTFSGGVKSFEHDTNGFWFSFERSKQRGRVETTTICVPRRKSDWIPVVSDTHRSPVDYDPASVIDEYVELLQSDLGKSLDELEGPFFRSTHGNAGKSFSVQPLGVNTLGKIPVEFAMKLLLPTASTYTGHCWRRSCGTNASNAGVNVTTLMAQMGWSTPKTALGYVTKSKVTSFNMSMFLCNVQRQNKVLEADGVRSTPKGIQLLKSDVVPRSASKKLDSDEDVVVGRVGAGALNAGSALGFHLIGAASSNSNKKVEKVLSDLESHERFVSAVERSSPSVAVTSSSSEIVSSNGNSSSSVLNDSSNSTVSVHSSESSVALDPRVSAILQNFQNNGSVQIHLHFHGKD